MVGVGSNVLVGVVGDVGVVVEVGVANCVDTELVGDERGFCGGLLAVGVVVESGLAGDNGGVGGALAAFGGGIGESSVSSSKIT